MAEQAAKLAQMLGAQGAIVTWDAGGNEFIEVVHTVRACERLGIKTVFLTSEDSPEGGAPSLLKPLPEADAIVTTGFFNNKYLDIGPTPGRRARDRLRQKVVGARRGRHRGRRDRRFDTGRLPAPWRYDDHYGFGSLLLE